MYLLDIAGVPFSPPLFSLENIITDSSISGAMNSQLHMHAGFFLNQLISCAECFYAF